MSFFITNAYAQESDAGTTAATLSETGDITSPPELSTEKMFTDTLLFLVLLFAIFYFMLIRPQQKKIKAHQNMVKSLKKGDKVITAGGVHGKIHKIENDGSALIEVAPDVKIKVSISSISEMANTSSVAQTANDN